MSLDDGWRDHAACTDSDPGLFFPDPGDPVANLDAARVCAGCEVRDDCLRYALNRRIEHGVWGGLSEQQRANLRRRGATQLTIV